MSFILDALKKSETDRQQRGAAEFASVPSSSGRREGPPAWLWVVAVLLFVNLAVLIGVLVRPDVKPVPAAEPVRQSVAAQPRRVADDFASQVATARENAPRREEPEVAEESPPVLAKPAPAVTIASGELATTNLPTIYQLQADGTFSLPELHVDIHVYSDIPEDRFVFINMAKLKEGSQLAEGPSVEEITPDGVVLRYNGTTFLLPRE